MKVTEFYLIDKYEVKSGQDDGEIYSDITVKNNHNFIGWIVEMPISCWGQTHGNWWIETFYRKGINSLGKNGNLKEGLWWEKWCTIYGISM